LKDTTDLLVELLNHLSITKVVVYGISAGGLTAIKFASNHTERTSKLILASAVSKKWLDKSDPTYKLGKIMFRPGLEGFVWSMVNFFSSLWPRLIANNFYPQFSLLDKHKLRKEDILELTASLKNYRSKAGFVHDLDQNIDEEALKQIRCPSLIIHSKNDASVPLDHALHAHESIPQSKLEVLDNEWGHLFWIGKDSNTAIAQTLSFIEEEV
jgi:pimeloyl-ACP methyl ester carboxylesterase